MFRTQICREDKEVSNSSRTCADFSLDHFVPTDADFPLSFLSSTANMSSNPVYQRHSTGGSSSSSSVAGAAAADTMPILVSWIPYFRFEAIYSLFTARVCLLLLVSFGAMSTFFALIVLAVSVGMEIPVWPPTIYQYGWALNIPNWLCLVAGLLAAFWQNKTMLLSAVVYFAFVLAVNLVVFAIQLVGGFSSLIKLNTTPNMFGVVVSAMFLVPSTILFTAALKLHLLLMTFQPGQPVHAYKATLGKG
jgi:hypothetical protein